MRSSKLVFAGVLVGLCLAACGGGGDDQQVSTPQDGTGGEAGTAGQAGAAGQAGQAGEAGAAGSSGEAGHGGSQGQDKDGDGYREPLDCDDDNAAVHPGAKEKCNGIDDDCNGKIDDADTGDLYVDADGDGYGTGEPVSSQDGCDPPDGYATQGGDCNDDDPERHPGATEVCDGKDQNCDGRVDEGLRRTFYFDFDGDGYGVDNLSTNLEACEVPGGYAEQAGDCDDSNVDVHPGVEDLPGNSIDEDCNGVLAPCALGTVTCEGLRARKCDSSGFWGAAEDCTGACLEPVGCVVCSPGEKSCDGNVARTCQGDGMGYDEEQCDALMGYACDQGVCTGPCDPAVLGRSTEGCEFFATPTRTNAADTLLIGVMNPNPSPVDVTITVDGVDSGPHTVGASSMSVIEQPGNELQTAMATMIGSSATAAYRIRATQPVAVYQMPWTRQSVVPATDASLLIPVHAWGTTYRVVARSTQTDRAGWYAVIAAQDNTSVQLTRGPSNLIEPGAGLDQSGTGTVTLQRGEVLQTLGSMAYSGEVTGTVVQADKPVMVLAGHACATVPGTTPNCGHLEEPMPPTDLLGTEYVVASPANGSTSTPRSTLVRVVATAPGTTNLSYTPDNPAWPVVINNPGEYVELLISDAVRITTDQEVLVAQYMQGTGGAMGEPSMVVLPPTDRFPTTVHFATRSGFSYGWATVVAPSGATVRMNGLLLGMNATITGTDYSLARVPITSSDALQTIESDMPVGVNVYGYRATSSYWYVPGFSYP